jgi:DNA-binding response OmpR family regulator
LPSGTPNLDLLLIESHRSLARSLRTGLEEEGFAVHAVDDPDNTQALLSSRQFAAIIVDIPAADGNIVQFWRQSGITTPVLVLSSPENPLENLTELGLGPGAFLVKPFAFDDLLHRLALLTGRESS